MQRRSSSSSSSSSPLTTSNISSKKSTSSQAGSRLLCFCSKRLILALLGLAGTAIAYALRVNLSFAIVCMSKPVVDNTTKNECAPHDNTNTNQSMQNSTSTKENEFEWSKELQGHVLGSFFYGYATSQMIGGIMSAKFGPKYVLLYCIFASSLLSLLSPVAARTHVAVFMAVRVFLGFTQGVLFPSLNVLWSNWAPPLERGTLIGISFAGAQIGIVTVMPLAGFLCGLDFDGGWPSVFYTVGLAGILWSILWLIFAASSPQTHRTITEPERKYILESLGKTKEASSKKNKIRLLIAILSSKPVWACMAGHFAGDFGAYSMFTGLPTFISEVLGMGNISAAITVALPYIVYFVVINISGYISDLLQEKHILSTLNTRRLAQTVSLVGQAVFLVGASFCGCGQNTLVIILLCLSIGISGFQYSGHMVNYLDICPKYAGFVFGIGNTFSSLAGIGAPLVFGLLTEKGARKEWQIVFFITAAILVVGAAIFSIFASDQVQPWANDDYEEESEEDDRKMATMEENVTEDMGHELTKEEGHTIG